MTLSPKFYTTLALDQTFYDKDTGRPLSEGTIEFYRDSSRGEGKLVYQLSGTEPDYTYTSMGNILTLSSTGAIVNSVGDRTKVYFYPYEGLPTDDPQSSTLDLYYVIIKNKYGVVQKTIEAVPNLTTATDGVVDPRFLSNQISNPQFGTAFLGNTETITVTLAAATDTTIPFAPDWTVVASGTGDVTLTRVPVAGTSDLQTNPPYVLRVTTDAGITKLLVRQRFNVNSGLWASFGASAASKRYLVSSVLAQALGSAQDFHVYYAESSGSNPALSLIANTANTGSYQFIKSSESVEVPQSDNSATGDSAYSDVYISLDTPGSANIEFSSIQVISASQEIDVNALNYDTRSTNRETSYLGDWFLPRLADKPIDDFLTGWDFRLNPAQWGTTGTMSNTVALARYIWDQTIALDTDSSATYARDSVSGGLEVTTQTNSDASFCIAQYLSGKEVKKMVGTKMSLNVNGYRQGGGAVTMRAHLYRAASGAAFPALSSAEFIVSTRSADGTVSGIFTGWTEIPRSNLPIATATLNQISADTQIADAANNYGFNGWEITDATQLSDTDKFCILLTFAYSDTGTAVTINDVSLVPGDIPCRSASKSVNEVLSECQRYYNKSFFPDTAPAQAAGADTGAHYFPANLGGTSVVNRSESITFMKPMVQTPDMVLYNPVSANAQVRDYTAGGDATDSGADGISIRGFFISTLSSAGFTAGDRLGVHWSADARLGK